MNRLLERTIALRNKYRALLDDVVYEYGVPDEYVVWDVDYLGDRKYGPYPGPDGAAWIGCGEEAWPIKDGPYPGPDDTIAYLSGDTLLIFSRSEIK